MSVSHISQNDVTIWVRHSGPLKFRLGSDYDDWLTTLAVDSGSRHVATWGHATRHLIFLLSPIAMSDASDSSAPSDAGSNPCAFVLPQYDVPLHIASVFIILVCSALGAGIPIVLKYSGSRIGELPIVFGKSIGTGVVLACGFVHMLQPSSQSLTSPCVPWEFNTDYNAYAFLYAMLAGLMLHLFDDVFKTILLARITKDTAAANGKTDDDVELAKKEATNGDNDEQHNEEVHVGHHVHADLSTIGDSVHKTVEAYMIEVGVTVHSIFIGLSTGVVDDATLHVLLVAFCFHQFFEGLALGSRIADAKFPSHFHEILLSTVFSVAAPIGLAVGVGTYTWLNPGGELFLMVQGTFDGICGGILIYLGYVLLLIDFPVDTKKAMKLVPAEYALHVKVGIYCCIYLGAGLMAYIGKYL